MKGLFRKIALVAILAASVVFVAHRHHKHKFVAPITPERRATHMLLLFTKDAEKPENECTGTAVGPNAILTASHCTEGDIVAVSLDLSVKKYNIIESITDTRDHTILHLDNDIPFSNIVVINQREAKLGEPVTSYGDGGGDFPQHTYFGKVVEQGNGGDTSELDALDEMRTFTIPSIPGDSGSAIYGTDGAIVALITYGDVDEAEDIHQAVGFALAFTPEQLEAISKQNPPKEAELPPQAKALEELLQQLNK